MLKKCLWAGICILALSIGSVVNATDMEAILDDSTSTTGFSVKDSNENTLMRVQGDGNVGIGTAGPDMPLHLSTSDDNVAKFEGTDHALVFIEGTSGSERSLNFTSDGLSGLQWKIGLDNAPDGNNADFSIKQTNNANAEFLINTNGNVGIGSTAPSHPLHMGSGAHVTAAGVWTDASSRELKENIRDLSVNEAMATLVDLRPSRFNYKVDKDDEYVGFIAEDVPELVATKDRKGLAPMDLTAVLTKVVQEQQKMLQEQKETIDAMKQEMEIMKSFMNYGVKGL